MLKSYRTLKTAVRALRRNVMRSGLTCLGIIIGIAAVIAMMEIGNGSRAMLQKTISDFGSNIVAVMPGAAASSGAMFGAGTDTTLTPQDCDAIIRECPAVLTAAPIVRVSAQVIHESKNWVPGAMLGTTPAYLEVQNWQDLDEGTAFTEDDVRNAKTVCVIGRTLVDQLFGSEDPVGKQLRIRNVPFTVLGVLSKKGANLVGADQDDILVAPWTAIKYRVSSQVGDASSASSSSSGVNTLSQLYPETSSNLYPTQSDIQAADTPQPVRFANVQAILAQATSAETIKAATDQITKLLHDRHRIHGGDPDDFAVRDMTQMIQVFSSVGDIMTHLLLGVATISLVVGGVGIMNIMLVSVTERTREIGLRMAVGARGSDILWQFLVEAILLCLTGGTVGILLGVGMGLLLRLVAHLPTAPSVGGIIAAVVVSAGVGVVFGFYPARRAARMDPIEALRYE